MKKVCLFVLFASLFIPVAASAATGVWHVSNIKSIYPFADGSFAITFVVPTSECSNASNYHYVRVGQYGMTADGAKNIFAAVLFAAAADKQVQAYFDKDSSDCLVNRVNVEN